MRILFGIPIGAALVLGTLHPSVAFAWGVGGGGASIPAFGALWQEPSVPRSSHHMKKGPNGGSVHRGWSKVKKKGWRSSNESR